MKILNYKIESTKILKYKLIIIEKILLREVLYLNPEEVLLNYIVLDQKKNLIKISFNNQSINQLKLI